MLVCHLSGYKFEAYHYELRWWLPVEKLALLTTE